MDKAQRARDFLEAARAGDIATARAMVTTNARHHNMYFAAEMTVLIDAIVAASVAFPASTFTPKRIITDGDMVVIHSHVTHQPGDAGMAVFHMLRFEGDLIAELWDVGQAINTDSPNQARNVLGQYGGIIASSRFVNEKSSMMSCKVQISLDLHTIEDALYVAEIAVQCGVDWLEAGTGLMVEQGLHVVTALRAKYPNHPIVCDFKVCDGASYFAKIAAAAGATHFDVMAASHDATLRTAGESARQLGLTAIADTMFCADQVAAAVRAEALGVQMIGWHLGLDHRTENRGLRAIDGLADVLKAVKIPVQVVGGLSIEDAITAAKMGASSVVIGGPLVPVDRGAQLMANLRAVVAGVRA